MNGPLPIHFDDVAHFHWLMTRNGVSYCLKMKLGMMVLVNVGGKFLLGPHI